MPVWTVVPMPWFAGGSVIIVVAWKKGHVNIYKLFLSFQSAGG
jgi:hypothetical protein